MSGILGKYRDKVESISEASVLFARHHERNSKAETPYAMWVSGIIQAISFDGSRSYHYAISLDEACFSNQDT